MTAVNELANLFWKVEAGKTFQTMDIDLKGPKFQNLECKGPQSHRRDAALYGDAITVLTFKQTFHMLLELIVVCLLTESNSLVSFEPPCELETLLTYLYIYACS